MTGKNVPFLSGCVLYLLLRKAALPDASAREHQDGIKDEHKNPIFMSDLVYIFTGVQTAGSSSDTSNYREEKIEGSINVPFNDTAYISAFDSTVRERYEDALARVCKFVKWHLNPEMRGWFVKACLDVIENDNEILDGERFYIKADGTSISKAELRNETIFELQPFLLGIIHFILLHRADCNYLGIPTLDANSSKVKYKERQYNGHLGDAIMRTIIVNLYEKKDSQEVVKTAAAPASLTAVDDDGDQTDDEVINGSLLRTGEALASVLGSINTPKINTEAMAGAIATVAAAAKAVTPDDQQKENIMQGAAAIATAFKVQRHSWAEQIRHSQRQGKAASESETTEDEKTAPGEDPGQEEKKTTIIQQQTNVIQNGDNNVNVTNNGTMNFNF